jgi:uncharacterized protein
MELFVIPIEDKYIIYRPLARLAFVGNQAMVELASELGAMESTTALDLPGDVSTFMRTIGFLKPDPPPPPLPDRAYRPTAAVLLLTNRCNLRCTYCYARGGEGPEQELAPELARVAIDRACESAQELGQPQFELTFHGGGEPVQAWETVQQATAYARSKDLPCHVSMVTNGVWSARQREWILQNLDGLSISFDGRPETQDRQRPFANGRGSFKAVMRTIGALDSAEFPYGIRMTATAPWRDELAKDVRFICEETGCPAMQVEPAFNTQRGEHQGPSLEESQAFVEGFLEAFEIAQRAGRRLAFSGARPWVLTQAFCGAPYGALIVNADGNVVACYEITDGAHPLAEMSTLGRIVDSRLILDHKARSAVLTHLEEKQARCRECFCYWHCAGDCYTRSFYAAAGSQKGANPRCYMNREITAQILLWYVMAGGGVWRGESVHPQEAQLLKTF